MNVLVIEQQDFIGESIAELVAQSGIKTSAPLSVLEGITCAAGVETLVAIVINEDAFRNSAHLLVDAFRSAGIMAPIVTVTSDERPHNIAKTLDAGADTVIRKPVTARELQKRIQRLAARYEATRNVHYILTVAPVIMDTRLMQVFVNGTYVDLSSRQYQILHVFMRNPGEIMSLSRITEQVYGSDYTKDNSVRVLIHHIREKLSSAGAPNFIHQMRSLGYYISDTR